MKKVFLSIVALAALVALPMSVSAQSGDASSITNDGKAYAKIVVPITFENDEAGSGPGAAGALNFGAIAQGANATDVKVDATSGGKSTVVGGGDAIVLPDGTYISNPAHFTFKGQTNVSYQLTVTPPTTLSNGTQTISIKDFDTNLTDGLSGTGVFTGSTQNLYVGATIVVPGSATEFTTPDFTGNFTVQISYN